MIKKYFIAAAIVASLALVVTFANASVSYNGFTFDRVVTTSQGTEYGVDLIAGPNVVETDSGRYDLEAALAFYGATNPENDSYFSSEIDTKTYVKYKKQGSSTYEHQMGVNLSGGTNIPNTPGRMVYYYMRSSTNGFFVEPGNYTVDAYVKWDLVASYDICLPSFTSATGNKIGNVVCGPAQPPQGSTSSPSTSSTSTATSSTSTQVGMLPGPYNGKFVFDANAVPTVTCDAQAQTCTFKKKLKGTQTGNIAVYLNFYPRDDFDMGGTKGFSSTGYGYSVKVYPGKTYEASITVPLSYLEPKMDAMQIADRKYYISFMDVMSVTPESNKKLYDFGTVIPMTTTPVNSATITFTLTSLLAPTTSVTIAGTVTSATDTMQALDLYMWPVGGQAAKVQTTQPLFITPAGKAITLNVASLQATTSYNYKLVNPATGAVVYESFFSTGLTNDQALGMVAIDGECGTAASSPLAAAPTQDFCSAGTYGGNVSGTGPWTWTCLGIDNGQDKPCSVASLSSASGPHCGPSSKTAFDDMPSSGLCDGGGDTASAVTATASGWMWSCTDAANAKVDCTTDKKTKTDEEDKSNKSASFLQNPFKTLDSFPKIIKAVVNNIVLPIAVPFVAVMLIYSGFLFVIARKNGNVYNLEKAKQTLLYTLIGATLILGCFVIANALQGTLNSIVATNYSSNIETRV